MTTERDIHNQIAYARDEGVEEGIEIGMEKGIEKGVLLMADQLRKIGIPEEEIERIVKEAEKEQKTTAKT